MSDQTTTVKNPAPDAANNAPSPSTQAVATTTNGAPQSPIVAAAQKLFNNMHNTTQNVLNTARDNEKAIMSEMSALQKDFQIRMDDLNNELKKTRLGIEAYDAAMAVLNRDANEAAAKIEDVAEEVVAEVKKVLPKVAS